jgi:hypothetical protein
VISGKQKLTDFPWSSYGEYLKEAGQRPPWLRVDRLLGEHGIPKDSPAGSMRDEEGTVATVARSLKFGGC